MSSVLVDSNILMRSIQPAHPESSIASGAIAELLRQHVDLCLAPQNLVEFWAVATRPAVNNGLEMRPIAVAGEIRKLRKIFRLLEGFAGVADAWEKLVVGNLVLGKQSHDANLVAVMLVHGVDRLLTFNGGDFGRFKSVQIIVPAEVARGQ